MKKVKVKRVSDKRNENSNVINTDSLQTKILTFVKEYEYTNHSEFLDKHYLILLSSDGERFGFVEVPPFISNAVISNIFI